MIIVSAGYGLITSLTIPAATGTRRHLAWLLEFDGYLAPGDRLTWEATTSHAGANSFQVQVTPSTRAAMINYVHLGPTSGVNLVSGDTITILCKLNGTTLPNHQGTLVFTLA